MRAGRSGLRSLAWHQYHDQPRAERVGDAMAGAFLGPGFSDARNLCAAGFGWRASISACKMDELIDRVARLLAGESVVGWFQGRMEFGPRALGGRSIMGDPRSPEMQSVMNLKIKYPRIVPAFRTGGAGRMRTRLFRTGSAQPVHDVRGAGP